MTGVQTCALPILGVVGRSGSGKSTISKLIQRLYIPESGKIMVDGVDISLVDPAWLRRQIGVVLQENFMFNGSIAERGKSLMRKEMLNYVKKYSRKRDRNLKYDFMPELHQI